MIHVRITTLTPSDDGKVDVRRTQMLADDSLRDDLAALAGRLQASRIEDVQLEVEHVSLASLEDVRGAVDDAMRARYGGWPTSLDQTEMRELRRSVINQGRTLQQLAEGFAVLTRHVMGGGAAEQLEERIPALRAEPAPRAGQSVIETSNGTRVRVVTEAPLTIDRERFLGTGTDADDPEPEPEAEVESDAVRAARALIAEVDAGRKPREVRLPIDESSAPPVMVNRGPDGKLEARVPVIRLNGANSERVADGAAGNVMSQGWGVGGAAARSNVEAFNAEGKLVATSLPTVGDSLKVKRSDID